MIKNGHEEVWITSDLRRIPVDEMSEAHVRNALRLVLRNFPDIAYKLENK